MRKIEISEKKLYQKKTKFCRISPKERDSVKYLLRNKKPSIFAATLTGLCLLCLIFTFQIKPAIFEHNSVIDSPRFTSLSNWHYHRGDDVSFSEAGWQELLPNEELTTEQGNIIWLSTTIPQGKWVQPVLYLPAVDQLLEVYADGRIIYQFGNMDVPKPQFAGWSNHILPLPSLEQDQKVYLRIYSNDYSIGLTDTPLIGEYAELLLMLHQNDFAKAFFAFFFILIALFALGTFWRRSSHLEYLYFGFFSLFMGLYTMTQLKVKLLYFNQPLFWTYLDLLSLYSLPLLMICFLQEVLSPKKMLSHLWQLDAVFLLGALLLELTGFWPLIRTLGLFQFLEVLNVLVWLFVISQSWREGQTEAKITFIGLVIFLLAALHDIFSSMQFILLPFRLVYTGVFILIVHLVFVLIYRYDKTHHELNDKNRVLEGVNNELQIARNIQLSLLPKAGIVEDRIAIFASATPAQKVGGDLYDYFPVEKNEWMIIAGDVSGKGIPASLFMAVTKTLLKTAAFEYENPGDILGWVNDRLCQENDTEMYTTSVSLKFDLKTGRGMYSNAGHCQPYILRRNGDLERLEIHGVPLGMFEEQDYGTSTFQLMPGEKIFFYTDGITEARNQQKELFGQNRLEDYLRQHSHIPAKKLILSLKNKIQEFATGLAQSDDMTILVLSYCEE